MENVMENIMYCKNNDIMGYIMEDILDDIIDVPLLSCELFQLDNSTFQPMFLNVILLTVVEIETLR